MSSSNESIKKKLFHTAHIWKPLRKLLNPTFSHKILSSFIPIFNEKIKIMADNLEPLIYRTEHFDICKPFFTCTMDMVCGKTDSESRGVEFTFIVYMLQQQH